MEPDGLIDKLSRRIVVERSTYFRRANSPVNERYRESQKMLGEALVGIRGQGDVGRIIAAETELLATASPWP